MNRISAVVFTLSMLTVVSSARSAVQFSDGGTHTISGAASDVGITNATTLNIVSGGNVIGSSAQPAIYSFDNSTGIHINVSGGSITGGSAGGSYPNNPQIGGAAIELTGGVLNVSGGNLTGGSVNFFIPGRAIDAWDSQVTISGGTFHGGNVVNLGTFNPASAAVMVRGGALTITGGTFIGGNSDAAYGGTALEVWTNALITGGTLTGGSGIGLPSFSMDIEIGTTDVKGGLFSSPIDVGEGTTLNVYGYGLKESPIDPTGFNHVTGTLANGSPISVDIIVQPTGHLNLIETAPEAPSVVIVASLLGLFSATSLTRRRLACR